MTPQQIEAMKMALEALEYALNKPMWNRPKMTVAITALEEALAQPEQEPVISKWVLREVYFDEDGEPIMHRSTSQRTWVGLTDEDMADITSLPIGTCSMMLKVEAKLKEKNGV